VFTRPTVGFAGTANFSRTLEAATALQNNTRGKTSFRKTAQTVLLSQLIQEKPVQEWFSTIDMLRGCRFLLRRRLR
jgi:hypothetical protein